MENEQEVREKIALILDRVNTDGWKHIRHTDREGVDYVDQIMQLIPTWRTFSQDCKPEVGDWFATKDDRGNFLDAGEWKKWRNEYLDRYVKDGSQFFIIPPNK